MGAERTSMKLVSQIGGYEQEKTRKSPMLKWLRKAGRRIPWGHVVWCVFALVTLLIALKAVSLMANAIKTVGGAG
jgi:hypothetical protein